MEDLALIKGFRDGLKPDPLLTVTEWAEAHRILSSVASAEPGPYRVARTPYAREIQDNLSAHISIEEIIWMKSGQVGATETGNNWIGYIISMVPSPVLMVMPTGDTMKRNSKIRIDPMIEATPILREKVKSRRKRDSDNTTMQKSFPGGVLVMAGANSASALASMPVRNLFLDEVDKYPDDVDGEGSAVDLAMVRTNTFSRRKIFKTSTPTIDGSSVIQREFLATDQRYFHIPCIHCGGFQKLVFEQMRWKKKEYNEAKYECIHCGELIEERFKPVMLAEGKWIADKPENFDGKRVGYHISALYSPLGWLSWGAICKQSDDAEGDTNKTKTFMNGTLGLCYVEKGDAPEWQRLFDKRENYPTNKPCNEVCFITIGVDVQGDRIELEIVGWAKGKKSYSIDYRVIVGDPSNTETWDKLATVVDEIWIRDDGVQMKMSKMCIDTGYGSSYVYDFCRRFDQNRVIPIKGYDKQQLIISSPKAIDTSKAGKKTGKTKIWPVGVSVIKSELYGWLKLDKKEDGSKPNGYCSFPQYGEQYFRGLTGETLEYRMVKGFRKYEWIKKYKFNEPLDTRVYARAAAAVVGIDRFQPEHYDMMVETFVPKNSSEQRQNRNRSSFWDK
jgi:phage terminase large subunit GpA-like protein